MRIPTHEEAKRIIARILREEDEEKAREIERREMEKIFKDAGLEFVQDYGAPAAAAASAAAAREYVVDMLSQEILP